MVAATLCPQMTAATEHAPEVLRLQSTAIAANVVFINIDWKASSEASLHLRLCPEFSFEF